MLDQMMRQRLDQMLAKDLAKAKQELDDATKNYNDIMKKNDPLLSDSQKNLDAVQRQLDKATTPEAKAAFELIINRIKEDMAKFEQENKAAKDRLDKAQEKWDKLNPKNNDIEDAQKALDQAEEELEKAKAAVDFWQNRLNMVADGMNQLWQSQADGKVNESNVQMWAAQLEGHRKSYQEYQDKINEANAAADKVRQKVEQAKTKVEQAKKR